MGLKFRVSHGVLVGALVASVLWASQSIPVMPRVAGAALFAAIAFLAWRPHVFTENWPQALAGLGLIGIFIGPEMYIPCGLLMLPLITLITARGWTGFQQRILDAGRVKS